MGGHGRERRLRGECKCRGMSEDGLNGHEYGTVCREVGERAYSILKCERSREATERDVCESVRIGS